MKFLQPSFLVLFSVVWFSCRQPQATTQKTNQVTFVADYRPKSEIDFLKRVKAENEFDGSNAAAKDERIKAFTKFAKDSLTKIADWEFIVTEVNDDPYEASSFATKLLDPSDNPCYNLMLAAPIVIDRSVDTIAIDNRVDFTYTILKNPKGAELKKQLITISTLGKGDTVIVSGSITHIDDNLKVNFEPLYSSNMDWTFDALITAIHIKHH